MRKEGKSKLMPLAIALSLVLTMIVLMPQQSSAWDAYVSRTENLTYADKIWVNVSGLTPGNDYEVYIENYTGGWETGFGYETADSYGQVSINVEVPYRNPLDDYDLALWDVTDPENPVEDPGTIETIQIYNTYQVKMFVGGKEVKSLLHNYTYDSDVADSKLTFEIYNGSSLIKDWKLDMYIYYYNGSGWPEMDSKINFSGGKWTPDFLVFDTLVDRPNREVIYSIYVEPNAYYDEHYGFEYTDIPLNVKLDVTVTAPTSITYGETGIDSVYINVKDRDGSDPDKAPAGVVGYTVALFAPIDGGYKLVDTGTTKGTSGKYTFAFDTTDGHAGTWFVGTLETSPEDLRIYYDDVYGLDIDSGVLEGFIPYGSFTVGTKTDGVLKVNSPSLIVAGFDVENMNVSVYEPNYDAADGSGDYYDDMQFHITGVDAYYDGQEWDSEDIIVVDSVPDGYSTNSKYAYYELDTICFNGTGTATIIATWPYDNTVYTDFGNPYLEADISTLTTFTVLPAADMTMIVEDMVENVLVEADSCGQKNTSTPITIKLFGDNQDEPMNASITIKGCGIDISIDEEDAIDDGYWCDDGIYIVDISPKTAGTLIITATNDTKDLSVSRDFTINGLSGLVTTSLGDDKKIYVQSDETIIVDIDEKRADVYLTYYDEEWKWISDGKSCMNFTTGDNTPGNGQDGKYEFYVSADDIENGIGYIVVAAESGNQWMYDIVEVVGVPDLRIDITSPVNATSLDLTVGLKHTYKLKVYGPDNKLADNILTGDVVGKIIDEDHDEDDPLQTVTFSKKGDDWQITDWKPYYAGTFVITATNDSGVNEHYGNVSLNVDLATISYSPDTATAGIEKEDLEVEVSGIDANGNPLPDGTKLYLNIEDDWSIEPTDETTTVTLDKTAKGSFTITCVGDNATKINATLLNFFDPDKNGNKTKGEFTIDYPDFTVTPAEIYINYPTEITIIAEDNEGNPLEGINLTLLPSTQGVLTVQPDPVKTDENGMVVLSVSPQASGKLNVTIVRDITYVGGQLTWTNAVVTDTYVTVTSIKPMAITVSKSPIYQGETLTVTIKSGATPVSDVDVTLGTVTAKTSTGGTVDFTVPDPGVDYAIMKVKAKKTGYLDASEDVTVLKKWEITISGPSSNPKTGAQFTVTVIAKGSPLAGATVTFEGTTFTSDGEGKATLTAPKTKGTYTVTATYENYGSKTLSVTVEEGGIPGFELITLIAAIGVAFILLRRRRK